MEIFIDFGLFEVLVVVGLASLSHRIYSSKSLAVPFLIASTIMPIMILILATRSIERCIAVICSATALVNAALIAAVLRDRRNSDAKASRS